MKTLKQTTETINLSLSCFLPGLPVFHSSASHRWVLAECEGFSCHRGSVLPAGAETQTQTRFRQRGHQRHRLFVDGIPRIRKVRTTWRRIVQMFEGEFSGNVLSYLHSVLWTLWRKSLKASPSRCCRLKHLQSYKCQSASCYMVI